MVKRDTNNNTEEGYRRCSNWRGITLLSVPGKILGNIVIERMRKVIDKELRKEQAGFRQGRATLDQIFILRNIVEQSVEWQAPLYSNFIDFGKHLTAYIEKLCGRSWNFMEFYDMRGEQWTAVRLGDGREWGETSLWNGRILIPLGTKLGHEKQRAREEHRD